MNVVLNSHGTGRIRRLYSTYLPYQAGLEYEGAFLQSAAAAASYTPWLWRSLYILYGSVRVHQICTGYK